MSRAANRQASPLSRRVAVDGEVELAFDDYEGLFEQSAGNLSTTGMFLSTASPGRPGTTFAFAARLADDRSSVLRGTAQVVWIRRVAEGPERPAGMGVRFVELEPASRRLLRAVVEERAGPGGEPFDWDAAAAAASPGGAAAPGRPAAAVLAGRPGRRRLTFATLAVLAVLAVAFGVLLWRELGPAPEPARAATPEPRRVPAAANPGGGPGPSGDSAAAAQREAVTATVLAWSDAWERQDPEAYLARYSQRFEPAGGTPRDVWERRRRQRLTEPDFIRVGVTALETELTGPDAARVRFRQTYRSDRYADTVRKRLDLVREDGGWRIVRESAEG